MNLIALTLAFYLQALIGIHDCASSTENYDEENIITNITKTYKKVIRPTSKLQISIKLSIKQISAIDEKAQLMTSAAYFSATWKDSRLEWDPALYGGTSEILISSSSLWMPDFYQINSANSNGYVTIASSSLAYVDSEGIVYVVFYLSQSKTRCKLSIKYFPFDTQTCSIIIGSWMIDTDSLDFLSDESKIDSTGYIQHPVWELKQINVNSVISSDRYFSFSKDIKTEDISFDFLLTRRPLYFMINNIFPCLILNVVVILLFTLPFNAQVGSCNKIFKFFF